MSIKTFRTIVDRLIQDDNSTLPDNEVENIILGSLSFHNRVKPKEVVADITGDGTYDYELPATYEDEFSNILKVEYPSGNREPTYLESEDWIIYKTSSTTKLRFINHTPSATETIRLTFTIAYTNNNIDTIPSNDVEPFCYLAAAKASRVLAMYYAQGSDSNIDADIVDYTDLSNTYHKRASALKKEYESYFGVANGVPPAMTFLDWDTNFQWGEKQITHGDITN